MVGPPGGAFAMISRFFDINRAVIGLKCIGAAVQSIDETIAYTKQRVVFGSPLAANQAVSFGVAEDLLPARLQLVENLGVLVLDPLQMNATTGADLLDDRRVLVLCSIGLGLFGVE